MTLLLANERTTTDAQWQHVRAQLERRSERENPLVAVVGLGVSTKNTQRRVEDLSERGIPMVGAVLTADTSSTTRCPA
jgi:hypothetical protein